MILIYKDEARLEICLDLFRILCTFVVGTNT